MYNPISSIEISQEPMTPKVKIWQHRKEGKTKVNYDGEAKGNPNKAGCGDNLQDHNGIIKVV